VTELADRLTDPAVTTDALTGTLNARVRSTERVQQQIAGALKEIVEVLDPDQREEFTYLLRTGAFTI
jgi:hypothetical protein